MASPTGSTLPPPTGGMGTETLVLDAAKVIIDRRCSNPITLPSGVQVRCQSRLKSVCPGCANLTAGDWAAIFRSGVFEAPTGYRFVALTLTAPSFGRTHYVVKDGRPPRRCGCGVTHDPVTDAALRGLPLDLDAYDYNAAVAWNYQIGTLWNRLLREIRRHAPTAAYALSREWGARGSLHIHGLVRFPAAEYLPPAVLERIVGSVSARDRHGHVHRFGAQVKVDPLNADGKTAQSIWYMTKAVQYMVKEVADGGGPSSDYGREHWGRLHRAATVMRCDKCPPHGSPSFCQARAHKQWGARSRVVTVSDARGRHAATAQTRWSFTGLTRASQRQARADYAASLSSDDARADRFTFAVQARRILDGERTAAALDAITALRPRPAPPV